MVLAAIYALLGSLDVNANGIDTLTEMFFDVLEAKQWSKNEIEIWLNEI